MTEPFDLRLGDCLEVLHIVADNSVDSVVTDPPYHLVSIVKRFGGANAAPAQFGKDGAFARATAGFMGQSWDGGDIAFRVELWAEIFRVLKPGGHLLAFSGTRTYHRMAVAIEDSGFEVRDQIGWAYGSGFPKSHNQGNGIGTALKPAWEPICLARKPLIGTVAENIAAWGTGGLNIDTCRVPVGEADARDVGRQITRNVRGADDGWGMNGAGAQGGVTVVRPDGRWPANLIHDGSDEVLATFPEAPGAQAVVTGNEPTANGFSGAVKFGGERKRVARQAPRGDGGTAARFFYCAKASQQDRSEGLEGKNVHPTVKPTALMRYLCRLVTPPGGLVLDPFMGSGSTGKAAMLEGFRFLGVERDTLYMEIARARVEFGRRAALMPAKTRPKAKPKPKPAAAGQADLFAVGNGP